MPPRLGLPRADLGSGRVIGPAGRVGLAAQIPARQSDVAGPNGCKAECSARLIHIEQDGRLALSGNSETALPIRGHELTIVGAIVTGKTSGRSRLCRAREKPKRRSSSEDPPNRFGSDDSHRTFPHTGAAALTWCGCELPL
jgi:hypothetical protein